MFKYINLKLLKIILFDTINARLFSQFHVSDCYQCIEIQLIFIILLCFISFLLRLFISHNSFLFLIQLFIFIYRLDPSANSYGISPFQGNALGLICGLIALASTTCTTLNGSAMKGQAFLVPNILEKIFSLSF